MPRQWGHVSAGMSVLPIFPMNFATLNPLHLTARPRSLFEKDGGCHGPAPFWRPQESSDATDIADYLRAYKAEGYELHETRLCKCNCGSTVFELKADRDEGCGPVQSAELSILSATVPSIGPRPNPRIGSAQNANATPAISELATPSMCQRKAKSQTCAGSQSASAAQTAGPSEALLIGKSDTVHHT